MIRLLILFLMLLYVPEPGRAADRAALSPAEAKALGLLGIKGKDDRILVPAAEAPWAAVGRVNSRVGTFCSGSLIGRKLVLTAAHCLWNRRTNDWFPVQSLHFLAGYAKGQSLGVSEIEAFEVAPLYRPGVQETTGGNSANDWALLTLKQDLGSKVGYFGLSETALAVGDRVTQVGYSKDHQHAPTANLACGVERALASGLILHNCDAVSGDSGSPLLVWRNGVFQVAGIHVSTVTTSKADGVHGGAAPTSAYLTSALKRGAGKLGGGGAESHPPVETAQLVLPLLGLDPGAPTGEVTPRTTKAIEDFQRLERQPVTGRADLELISRLLSALVRQKKP